MIPRVTGSDFPKLKASFACASKALQRTAEASAASGVLGLGFKVEGISGIGFRVVGLGHIGFLGLRFRVGGLPFSA